MHLLAYSGTPAGKSGVNTIFDGNLERPDATNSRISPSAEPRASLDSPLHTYLYLFAAVPSHVTLTLHNKHLSVPHSRAAHHAIKWYSIRMDFTRVCSEATANERAAPAEVRAVIATSCVTEHLAVCCIRLLSMAEHSALLWWVRYASVHVLLSNTPSSVHCFAPAYSRTVLL